MGDSLMPIGRYKDTKEIKYRLFKRLKRPDIGRHLSEFTSVDLEAAYMDYTDVMNVLENLVLNTFKYC